MKLINKLSNIFRKKNEISLHDLCTIINTETFTQQEYAKEVGVGVRHIKRQTAEGKLKPLRFKGNPLYLSVKKSK